MNIYASQLLRAPIEDRGDCYAVPEGPGMGIEVDENALQHYIVDYTKIDHVRQAYRYARACGEVAYLLDYRSAFHGRYT